MIRPDNPPFRSYILNAVKDDSYLPEAYRWLYKYHVEDSIAKLRPYCNSYCTYRALPIPPDGEDYGTYNWIMTEHHWMYNPSVYWGPEGRVNILNEVFDESYLIATNQPPRNSLRDSAWQGSRDGYHPIVYTAAPLFWEKDFKGAQRTIADGANFRWLMIFKYPKGVSREEGDEWFLTRLAPQIAALDGVNRFVTSRTLDQTPFIPDTWHRVAEVWFDNSRVWHDCIVKNADQFAKPAWANYDVFPYLEPYRDFTGIFLLDRPESDHFNQYRGYIPTR